MINHPRRSRRTIAVAAAPVHDRDADYAAFLTAVRASFAAHTGPLFRTNTDGLFTTFLDALPSERQIHTCSCCHSFIKHYGGIVAISADGRASSPFWTDDVPDFYKGAVAALRKTATKARIVSPFLSREATWGTPQTGTWTHFAVTAPNPFKHALLSAGQAMAAKREDFATVARALSEFTPDMIGEAIRVLESDTLSRAERFLSPARWLADLHEKRAPLRGTARDNVLWLAVATAPDGYCHPRSGMIGTLLEDIAAGMDFGAVKARWEQKAHPLQYQRPQAAPSAGNIQQAEKIVEAMGIAPALERRFARLDEIETIWKPTAAPKAVPTGSVFGHLAAKGTIPSGGVTLPTQTMAWEKFARVVLPEAEGIELNAPAHGNYTAMLAAADPNAPPILKWDREDKRNTVSWYVYHDGSAANQWRVTPGWTKVTGIAERPNMWGDQPQPHLGESLALVLEGAVDTRTGQGNALFPECLRTELHAVRSTIEAFSKRASIGGVEEASACGLGFQKGAIGITVRVTAGGRQSTYTIDRWD